MEAWLTKGVSQLPVARLHTRAGPGRKSWGASEKEAVR
jgi:hypothetical protein